MPTAARLFAALGFAAIAFFASESFIRELPEGTNAGWFSQINALLGAVSGWSVMGRLAGRGYGPAVTSGARTTATFVFYALVGHGLYEMIRMSMKLRYGGPGEAVLGFFDIVLEYGQILITSWPVMAILLIGGTLAAWLSEWAAARWS